MHKARKRFGQNFLQDPSVIENILHCLNFESGQCVLEIGPGQGAMTKRLLQRFGKLIVVEIDRDLVALLKKQFAQNDQLTIYEQDVLTFDLKQLEQDSIHIVGNLPYNISTPLLFHLFEQIEFIASMTFMLQKEVVERLCAPAGSSEYSRLSVMAQFFAEIEHQFDVPAEAFSPKPKVTSSVVTLLPKTRQTETVQIQLLSKVVKQAFSQRRKTLKNNLKSWLSTDDFSTLGIAENSRAQELSVEDYILISDYIKNTSSD